MDDYWDRQVPNILTFDLHSSFERGLRSQDFRGGAWSSPR
ncbi:FcoT family thioesterase [Kitasatospora sp. NPDC050467]